MRDKLSLQLIELEKELKSQKLWNDGEFDESKFNSTAPFCCDTMEFHEWLQYIFIPKMTFILEAKQQLPTNLAIAPMGEVAYRHELLKRKSLLKILEEIDQLFK